MRNLFGEDIHTPKPKVVREVKLGCERCTLNDVGVNKVINIDRVTGRKVFVWTQTPGKRENAEGIELVGPAGQFLWRELAKVGVERRECDVQNVVRCQPVTSEDGNTPTKAQIKCCSPYNDQALAANKGRAVVHLILGKIAGMQMLGKDYSRAKKHPIWHEPLGAYAVVADHPSRILREGGAGAGWNYRLFRLRLEAVKAILDHPGKYGHVLAQNYGAVTRPASMEVLKNAVLAAAEVGRRVSVDIEDGEVGGKRVVLMVGFGWGEGAEYQARSVVLAHPGHPAKENVPALTNAVRELLEDPAVKKALQHGSYDVERVLELLRARVRGYDYDSQYAAFLYRSHLRTYGLDSLVGYFCPAFADYKDMVREYHPNLANCPLKVLVPYNCADTHVTKIVEEQTRGKISHELLQVYVNAAFTLGGMERRGPILDREEHAKVLAFVVPRMEKLLRQLRDVAEDEEFNPNTPQRVAKLLYDKLGLPRYTDPKTKKPSRSTGKDALDWLTQKSKHPAVRLMQRFRKISKMEGTLKGYAKSAELHDGELRTIWWLTGAATGRLRSGKSEKAEIEEGVLNFQNLYKSAVMKNPLVSDKNWRRALEE